MQLFNTATDELEGFLLQSVTPELAQTFVAVSPGPAAEEALFGLFAEYVVRNYSNSLQTYRYTVIDTPSHTALVCRAAVLAHHYWFLPSSGFIEDAKPFTIHCSCFDCLLAWPLVGPKVIE